ncbi:hypothetical protein ACJJTC_016375 [Scirpophaga incertulas]
MKSDEIRFPIDRYLVESSKQIQMASIVSDNWIPEPALRPEDEIILRNLHEMLRSTADDLKILSGELSKFHEPGVQIKSQPTPLDEDFNEKVHIEEIVNAKFHGHKILDKTLPFSPESKPKKDFIDKVVYSSMNKPKALNVNVPAAPNTYVQKSTHLGNLKMSRPKIVNILAENGKKVSKVKEIDKNNTYIKSSPVVSYNEVVYKYTDSVSDHPYKKLQKQNMPIINIRSELKQQTIFNFDIAPELKDGTSSSSNRKNVGVIVLNHDSSPISKINTQIDERQEHSYPNYISKQSNRKISKIGSYDSNESSNNISSSTHIGKNVDVKQKVKYPTKLKQRLISNKNVSVSKKQEKRSRLNIEEWRKKLDVVYGQKSSVASKTKSVIHTSKKPQKNNSNFSATLNNAEYIPYSKLTLGGARVSDIEREISDIPIKTDFELGPVLGKILGSRENSFDSPRKNQKNTLTVSDENLLQEVLNIEKAVSETLTKKDSKISETNKHISSENSDNNSYPDDFEDDNTESKLEHINQETQSNARNCITELNVAENIHIRVPQEPHASTSSAINVKKFSEKSSNLSIKDEVDIIEFIHMIDTQETGTQSTYTSKKSLKGTQTSPRVEKSKIQPIHNDLWPAIDPKGEVENLFQLEKDFIKKLILEEYGQIIENDITKPASSKQKDYTQKNVSAMQKITQTSPARVKSVMTSPTRTKTRTTSPFPVLPTVNQQTSPVSFPHNSNNRTECVIESDPEELAISANLSSPKFSLRLPQNSREVITNLNKDILSKTSFRNNVKSSSTSSADAEYSSSEISSLGEVKLKRKQIKNRVQLVSNADSSSIASDHSTESVSGGILPLKSEGEMSLEHMYRRTMQHKSSEGEVHIE